MAGLSVGTWVKQNPLTFDLSVDRPLNLYGGKELSIESFSEKGNIKRIFADKNVFCKLRGGSKANFFGVPDLSFGHHRCP